jgi:hypothetical protein
VLGIWILEFGIWNLGFGIWHLEFEYNSLSTVARSPLALSPFIKLEFGSCLPAAGGEFGSWNLGFGIWPLEFGSWNF